VQNVLRGPASHSVGLLTEWRVPTSRMVPTLTSHRFCDSIDSGIVVSFDDGKTALYSAFLLRPNLPASRVRPTELGTLTLDSTKVE
jgi:hypothetical protein